MSLAIQPNLESSEVVFVTFVDEDTNNIWLQRNVDSSLLDKLNSQIEMEVFKFEANTEPLLDYSANQICLCKSAEDDLMYRGRICSTSEDTVLVYYVDYGNKEELSKLRVRKLPASLYKQHELSYSCCLQTNKKIANLASIVDWEEEFTVQVVKKDGGIYVVNLFYNGTCILKLLNEKNEIMPVQPQENVLTEITNGCKENSKSISIVTPPSDINLDFITAPVDKDGIIPVQPCGNVHTETTNSCKDSSKSISTGTPPSGVNLDLIVAHIDKDGSLWVQILENLPQLDDVMEKLESLADSNSTLSTTDVGLFCSAKYSLDMAWYRAQITCLNEDSKEGVVKYVDYGNSESVLIANLKPLPSECLDLPAQAIRCCIYSEQLGSVIKDERFCDLEFLFDALINGSIHIDASYGYVIKNAAIDGKPVEGMLIAELNLVVPNNTPDENMNIINVNQIVKHLNERQFLDIVENYSLSSDDEFHTSDKSNDSLFITASENVLAVDEFLSDNKIIPELIFDSNKRLNMLVTHSEKDYVWVQVIDYSKELDEMMTSIDEFMNIGNLQVLTEEICADTYCISKYMEDGGYYRAKVVSVDTNDVCVYYVDYGNSSVVSKENLYIIPDQFLTLPCQAVYCSVKLFKKNLEEDLNAEIMMESIKSKQSFRGRIVKWKNEQVLLDIEIDGLHFENMLLEENLSNYFKMNGESFCLKDLTSSHIAEAPVAPSIPFPSVELTSIAQPVLEKSLVSFLGEQEQLMYNVLNLRNVEDQKTLFPSENKTSILFQEVKSISFSPDYKTSVCVQDRTSHLKDCKTLSPLRECNQVLAEPFEDVNSFCLEGKVISMSSDEEEIAVLSQDNAEIVLDSGQDFSLYQTCKEAIGLHQACDKVLSLPKINHEVAAQSNIDDEIFVSHEDKNVLLLQHTEAFEHLLNSGEIAAQLKGNKVHSTLQDKVNIPTLPQEIIKTSSLPNAGFEIPALLHEMDEITTMQQKYETLALPLEEDETLALPQKANETLTISQENETLTRSHERDGNLDLQLERDETPSLPDEEVETPSQPHEENETPSMPHEEDETPSMPHEEDETPSMPHEEDETPSMPHEEDETPSLPQEDETPSLPKKEVETPSLPQDDDSPSLPQEDDSPSLPQEDDSPSLPQEDDTPSLPQEDDTPSLPQEDDTPSLPQEDDTPSLPQEDDTPPLPQEDDTPSLPQEDETPSLPQDDDTPSLPHEDDTPSLPHEDDTPSLPHEDDTPPLPQEDDTPSLPQEDDTPSLQQEDDTPSLPQEDDTPSLPQEDDTPSLPQEDDAFSLPQEDDDTPSLPQEDDTPSLPQEDDTPSLPQEDDDTPSLPQEDDTPSLPQEDDTPSLPQEDDTPSLPQEDDTPSLPQEDDTPSLPQEDDTPSLPQEDDTPSLPQEDDTPSLPQEDDTPSLPQEDDTPSLPQEDDTPSLSQEDDTPSLPQDYDTPSLSQKEDKTPSLPQEEDKTPSLPQEEDKTPSLPIEEDKTPSLSQDEDKTPSLPQEEDETPSLPQKDDETPSLPQKDYETPSQPQEEDETPSFPQEEDEASSLPQEEDEAPSLLQEEDEAPSLPQEEDEAPSLPQEEDEAPSLPQEEDEAPSLPQEEDEAPSLPQEEDETLLLPQEEDETPFMPHEEDETPSLPKEEDETPPEPQKEDEAPSLPQEKDATHSLPQEEDEIPAIINEMSETSALKHKMDESTSQLPEEGKETTTVLPDEGKETTTVLPREGKETTTVLPEERAEPSSVFPEGEETTFVFLQEGNEIPALPQEVDSPALYQERDATPVIPNKINGTSPLPLEWDKIPVLAQEKVDFPALPSKEREEILAISQEIKAVIAHRLVYEDNSASSDGDNDVSFLPVEEKVYTHMDAKEIPACTIKAEEVPVNCLGAGVNVNLMEDKLLHLENEAVPSLSLVEEEIFSFSLTKKEVPVFSPEHEVSSLPLVCRVSLLPLECKEDPIHVESEGGNPVLHLEDQDDPAHLESKENPVFPLKGETVHKLFLGGAVVSSLPLEGEKVIAHFKEEEFPALPVDYKKFSSLSQEDKNFFAQYQDNVKFLPLPQEWQFCLENQTSGPPIEDNILSLSQEAKFSPRYKKWKTTFYCGRKPFSSPEDSKTSLKSNDKCLSLSELVHTSQKIFREGESSPNFPEVQPSFSVLEDGTSPNFREDGTLLNYKEKECTLFPCRNETSVIPPKNKVEVSFFSDSKTGSISLQEESFVYPKEDPSVSLSKISDSCTPLHLTLSRMLSLDFKTSTFPQQIETSFSQDFKANTHSNETSLSPRRKASPPDHFYETVPHACQEEKSALLVDQITSPDNTLCVAEIANSLFETMKKQIFLAYLVHVSENPICLWMQMEEDRSLMDKVERVLKDYAKGFEVVKEFERGQICTSYYCGSLLRARVLSFDEHNVQVQFIDIGKTCYVGNNDLYDCPSQIRNIASQAIPYNIPMHFNITDSTKVVQLINKHFTKTLCSCVDINSYIRPSFRRKNVPYLMVESENSGNLTTFLLNSNLGTVFNVKELMHVKLFDEFNHALREAIQSLNVS